MDREPDCILTVGKRETKFYNLASETFPKSEIPLEMRIEGDFVLELQHVDSSEKDWQEPEYLVNLHVGRHLTAQMGQFKKEEPARQRYEQCLNILKSGGHISFRVDCPQILDSNGKVIVEQSYGRLPEDCQTYII